MRRDTDEITPLLVSTIIDSRTKQNNNYNTRATGAWEGGRQTDLLTFTCFSTQIPKHLRKNKRENSLRRTVGWNKRWACSCSVPGSVPRRWDWSVAWTTVEGKGMQKRITDLQCRRALHCHSASTSIVKAVPHFYIEYLDI
jgi:hypothetical protein